MSPSYGGPVEGLLETSAEQSRQGHAVEILTLDAPGSPGHGRLPVSVGLTALGPSRFPAYGYNPGLVPWLRRNGSRFDAVIVHGVWDYAALGVWRALSGQATPYFIYPHGMLDPWFRGLRGKHLKKCAYWKLLNHRAFRDAAGVLFLCEEERRQAQDAFLPYAVKPLIAGHGTASPDDAEIALGDQFLSSFPQLGGKRVILYLGRLHPKKGCDLLIQAFSRLNRDGLHLVIAGGGNGPYVDHLRGMAGPDVTFTGFLAPQLRFGAMHAADVFALPSHGENFGLAVVEALARSLPVLISDKVNIWREIVEDGAGFSGPDTVEGTLRMLENWLDAPQDPLRSNARRCFERRFEIDGVTSRFLKLLSAETLPANFSQPQH